jgi:signal recognition particle subunit SEC65
MSNKTISVYSDALKRKEDEEKANLTREGTPKITWPRETSSALSRENIRIFSRENPRRRPTRDEIQEFSFRLRDEIKVKVQAEVPHAWQKELEQVALQLDVKKLELYRFIIGKFLDKV